MPERLGVGKLGWAIGELGLASYTAVASIYLLFYATEQLHIPATLAGLALLVPRLWNIVGDPIIGVLSDRTRTRFGRRRPYLLIGALVWGAAFALLFNLPPSTDAWLFGAIFLLNNTGLTLYQVPYSAMLAEMTGDAAERTRLVAYKEVAARVAVLLTLACAPRLMEQTAGFSKLGWIFGASFALCGLIAFFATAHAPASAAPTGHQRMTLQLGPLLDNRPFAMVTLSFLCVNLGDAVFSGSLLYYVTQVLHRNAALIGVLYPVGSVTGILCTPVWTWLANRYGKVLLCRVALAMNAALCIVPWLLPSSADWLMYPFMSLYGLFNTGARLLPGAIVPDTVELDQRRTGQRREGVIFGLFVFAQQTGFAAGGFILSVLLTAGGVMTSFTLGSAALYGLALIAMLGFSAKGLMPNSP